MIGLLFFSFFFQSDHGQLFIRSYPVKEYKGAAQIWAITQDSIGNMLFGNSDLGILVYNGAQWKHYSADNQSTIRSLSRDSQGRIYTGAISEIGRLHYSVQEGFHYQSLNYLLNKSNQNFSDIWTSFCLNDKVYYYSDDKIFVLQQNKIHEILPRKSFFLAYATKNRAFVSDRNFGLFDISSGHLELIDSGFFKGKKIYYMLDYQGKILIGTRENGHFLYDGSQFIKWNLENESELSDKQNYTALNAANGDLLIGTLHNGIYVYNEKGQLVRQIKKESGLNDNTVYCLFEDREKSIWVGHSNGISRIDYAIPFQFLNDKSGLVGAVLDIEKFDDFYYVGTFNGLFKMDKHLKVSPVKNLNEQIWAVTRIENKLLIGTNSDLKVLENGQLRTEAKLNVVFSIYPSPFQAKTVYIGTSDGLFRLQLNHPDKIEIEAVFYTNAKIRTIVQTDPNTIWLGSNYEGLLKYDLRNRQIKKYGPESGLPSYKSNNVFFIDAILYIGTDNGLYEYKFNSDHFAKSSLISAEDLSNKEIYRVIRGNDQVIFATGINNRRSATMKIDHSSIESSVYRIIPEMAVYELFYDPEQSWLFIGGTEGLFVQKHLSDFQSHFNRMPHIRLFLANNDTLKSTDEKGRLLLEYQQGEKLRMAFNTPYYILSEEMQYQSYLEGFDKDWSEWSHENYRDFTNLADKPYRLHVRAKNYAGLISNSHQLEFIIKTPFYYSLLAQLAYLLAIIYLIYLIFQWRMQHLNDKKNRLEHIIYDRTKEILSQKEQLSQIEKIVKLINSEIKLNDILTLILEQILAMETVHSSAFYYAKEKEIDLKLIRESYKERGLVQFKYPKSIEIKNLENIFDEKSLDFHVHYFEKENSLHLRIPIFMEKSIQGLIYIVFKTQEYEQLNKELEYFKFLKEHFKSAIIKAQMIEKLESLNDMKNQYVGIVAHDLRNPLASVYTYLGFIVEYLESMDLGNDRIIADIKYILSTVDQMNRMISDLLDISAIEAGKVQIKAHKIHLNEIIDGSLKLTKRLAEHKNINIEVDSFFKSSDAQVSADKDKMIAVMDNILSNAIKYSQKDSKIIINGKVENSEIIIRVKDQGQGMDAKQLEQIFDAFKTAESIPTEGEKSTGLGLAIVKKIIELHEGKIWIKTAKQKGTEVFFSLKLVNEN